MAQDPFKQIVEKALREADRYPVDRATFERGLVTMWHEINDRLEAEGINPRDPDMLSEDEG